MFPVVGVLGFILWKWANSSDSPDPNLDCRIGSKVFADGSSHCFTSIWELGNRRSSERLHCFNSSKGTNLATLIILAGDIETNPSPSVVFANNTARCRTRWSNVLTAKNAFMQNAQTGNSDWYCTNCKADCGLCSGVVLSVHKAVLCDGCEMWIHNECSFITEAEYENVLKSGCTWICPKCEFFNFSDSFFADQLNLMNRNKFDPLTKGKKWQDFVKLHKSDKLSCHHHHHHHHIHFRALFSATEG